MFKLIGIMTSGAAALFGMGYAYSYVGNYCINSYGGYGGYFGYGCTTANIPTLSYENTILLVLILIAVYSICMNPKRKTNRLK
jgi:hypothetical protein